MSLTRFLGTPDVKAKVKLMRPETPRKIAPALKVEPRSERHQLVGMAFDYLLRFELQRRAPHAITRAWVAEWAPMLADTSPEANEHARLILEDAKAAVFSYVRSTVSNQAEQADMAGHAIRLAKLDFICRARWVDPRPQEAEPEDVQDLLEMLAIVPFESLLHDKILILNPTFGEASILVGGADADLITADMLVDFKATKKGSMEGKDLDQLLGYYLLGRKHRQTHPEFPEINRPALYFCRHGYLWTMRATSWTDHPDFRELERWFFERAQNGDSRHQVQPR